MAALSPSSCPISSSPGNGSFPQNLEGSLRLDTISASVCWGRSVTNAERLGKEPLGRIACPVDIWDIPGEAGPDDTNLSHAVFCDKCMPEISWLHRSSIPLS